ncbi:MAG: tetratricopeptide repeat protein [bacterium]
MEELIDDPGTDREIREEAQLLLGNIQFEQEFYSNAKDEYFKTTKISKNKEVKAKAFFQLGQSQLKTGDYYDAVESFQNALKYSSSPQFWFESKLNYGRSLKLSGEFKQATNVCYSLLERESFKDRHGLVKLEIADCIYREGKALFLELKAAEVDYLGKIEKAIDEYKKITLEYKRTDVSARAYFQIARIYEEDFGDFAQAKEYYEKVKTEYNRSELLAESNQKSKDISELIRLKNLVKKSQIKQLDAGDGQTAPMSDLEMLLLEHGVHPELRFMKRKRLVQKESRDVVTTTQAGKRDSVEIGTPKNEDLDSFIINKLRLAETYLFQFGQIDSARYEYDEIIRLFPDHPGVAIALYTTAFIYENEYHNKTKTDSLLYVLIERFPDSAQAQEARKILSILPKLDRHKLAFELYKIAENSLFNKRDIEEALRNFRKISRTYPETNYAPKALFAIGWIQERLVFNNAKAVEIYREILEKYPKSEFAQTVKMKLSALEKDDLQEEPQKPIP